MPEHQHRAGRGVPRADDVEAPVHRVHRKAVRGTVSVALVLALSGALFTANARLARGSDERQPQDLAGLQASEEARRARLFDEVDDLRTEVDRLTAEQAAGAGIDLGTVGGRYDVAGGTVPVTGPGLAVELDDAPQDGFRATTVNPDDLVVHQQDLQAVINALWAGGAEAMTLMDQRVISTSAFQCIGNVLLLQGRRYSPPYVVTAIGDPDLLRKALDDSPAIQVYREYVDAVGLGWSVTEGQSLELPAYDGSTDLVHATVPDGTEVLPGLVAGGSRSADEDKTDTDTGESAGAPDEGTTP
ncbi:hypothetical protein AGMMS50218_04200 [Actinomycetota bacterium]|nr:hypothetical protein AGMMS50218_04200 [Actinomycetota bacterium]